MEAKLKEYRALRRRKELIENTKVKIEKSKQKFYDLVKPLFYPEMSQNNEEEVVLMENEEQLEEATSEIEEEDELVVNPESWLYFMTKWIIYSVVWLTLFLFFIKIEFGAVFFAFSVLVFIYLNTRTRPKKKGEVSAYSVFNQDCESIDGTLTAEKLQREMMLGMLR